MILKTNDDGHLVFESAIGEVVDFNGTKLLTCKGDGCDGCFRQVCDFALCFSDDRKDGESVLFRDIAQLGPELGLQ